MAFTVTVTYEAGLLCLQGAGPASLTDLCGLASLGGTVSQRSSLGRVLVDLRDTLPELSFTDHIQLGAHFAHEFRQAERVATVVQPRDRVGTSEKAARRSGLTLQTFTDANLAREWLAGPAA
ncbi:hypothetical protein [Ramlibacter sp.]|uniref:hypothetical protein n=1 Tax=Ramlibacter sp. TaxID=1917967 RepID=UPI002FC69F84